MTADEIRAELTARIMEVCRHLFPAGRLNGDEFEVGSLRGEAGHSLKVNVNGKAGTWRDFAEDVGGSNLLELWHRARGHSDIRTTMNEAATWLGSIPHGSTRKPASGDNRGVPKDAPVGHPGWTSRKPVGRWCYRDAAGTPWLTVYRYRRPDGRKSFHQYDHRARRWIEKNGHQLPVKRPLYRLDTFVHRPASEIVLVEGEKCADALAGLGFLATTTLGGCGQVRKADFAPLSGWRVTILPDNDPAGDDYAQLAASGLREAHAAEVRLAPVPPDKPKGWDVADAIAEGCTAEEIKAQLDAAEPLQSTESEGNRLVVLSFDEVLNHDTPKRQAIVQPWLFERTLAMVYAWRGIGKTLYGLWLAYAIATGGKFLRYNVPERRRTLYADGEMPFSLMKERMQAIAEAHGGQCPDPGYFSLLTPDVQPLECPIPDLSTIEGQARFEPLLEGIDVLFLDNISTLFRTKTQNEQESWQLVQPWALRLRRRGMSVVFIHHAGKGGDQRGTSQREDALDVSIKLSRPQGYDITEGARFKVEFTKSRGIYGDDVEPFEASLTKNAHGAPIWTIRDPDDVKLVEVAERKRKGLSLRDIASELHIPKSTVHDLLKRAEQEGLL